MSVEFDNSFSNSGNLRNRVPNNQPSTSGMAGWLVRKNIVKDKSGADKLLVTIAIGFFLASIAVFLFV